MEILVREIEEWDYTDVLGIWNNELGNHYFTAENFSSHHNRFKDNDNYKAFVAELEGHVVGIVYIMQYAPWGVEGEQFWIQGIGVRNDMQGKGIGTKLLNTTTTTANEDASYDAKNRRQHCDASDSGRSRAPT